ncbi:MAG: L-serine ammonia-lyase, iron-sulfur-dependent subunit beta [Pseudobutyrivibrio sp.]|nr:L-serine ammonia-lyase, iron-sulfur-dependent subunit beta [Pseudobutyrivibrio sp.]
MNLFDIVGPIMVGPSSSHTAGACRIGLVARKLAGDSVKKAIIQLHGSFALSGKGHGTDKALVAGLLNLDVSDSRIPSSFELAKEMGLDFTFETIDLGEKAHPNSVRMILTNDAGETTEVVSSSIGAGRIMVNSINGMKVDFTGEYPTLIITNTDQPGCVANVSAFLHKVEINIATLSLHRNGRGKSAVMIIECDEEVYPKSVEKLRTLDGILNVTYYSPL